MRRNATAETTGRRRAVPVRRSRLRRPSTLFGGLLVAHLAVIGGVQPLLAAGPEADAALAAPAVPSVAPDPVTADVRAGTVPRPGVVPLIQNTEPAAPSVPHQASRTYAAAPAPAVQVPAGAVTYRIEVEKGLPYGPRAFARAVDATLHDPRSWPALTGRPMVRVDGDADLRVVLASPGTTDELCAPLDTKGKVSCRNGDDVVINAMRWAEGAPSYDGDLAAYRIYVVNHEVGHGLGHGHTGCTGPGEKAPVMLQQTLGLQGCRANPWPLHTEVH